MKLKLLCALFAVTLLLSGCGNSTTHRPLKKIKSEQTLNVAVVMAGEPYAYMSGGQFAGKEIDFIKDFAASLGVNPVMTAISVDEVPQFLRDGSADVAIGGLTSQLAGSLTATLTSPLREEKIYALSLRGTPLPTIEAMTQKKIGCLGEDSYNALSSLRGAAEEFYQIDSREHAIQLLLGNNISAVCCYASEADAIINASGDEFECNDLIDALPVAYGAAVSRNNAELLRELNRYIFSLKQKGGAPGAEKNG